MTRRLLLSALVAASTLLGACANGPHQVATCSRDSVLLQKDAAGLRTVGAQCADDAELYALAKAKLNELPPPVPRQFSFQSPVSLADSERVRYEVDVYFDFLEAYPPEIAFEKLNDLISRFDTSYRIEAVEVVGSQEELESRMKSFQVAQRRAEFIKRYLLAAGLNGATKVDIQVRNAKLPDTPEGRARDRVAEVRVWAVRRRSSAK